MSRIPYDLTKIRGMAFDVDGVLSPIVVPLGLNGLPNRMVNLRDGYALQLAVKKGFHMAIISGARASGIEQRFASLGFQTVVMEAKDKVEVMNRWMAENGLNPEEVVYAGDDVPDLGAVRLAGLGVAPADACADILEAADYISPCIGGYGVGRDIVEQVMRAQGIWPVGGA
ncbi:MAG: HAD hydrolase family protein [Clostridium sp.]|nr:HAD hydrolase family protein [Clostridium sp.]